MIWLNGFVIGLTVSSIVYCVITRRQTRKLRKYTAEFNKNTQAANATSLFYQRRAEELEIRVALMEQMLEPTKQ